MGDVVTMNYTLSAEAQKTIDEMVKICAKNDTDTITMEIDYPHVTLEVEMGFIIHPKKENQDGED